MAKDVDIAALAAADLGASASSEAIHVVVAIATFRRPKGLDTALKGVAALAVDPAWRVETLVVDNSPEGDAAARAEGLAAAHGFPLAVMHETARGISHARNRALDVAAERGARYLAFLDDDEEPESGWLAALIAMAERTNAAAVVGPVTARFAREPSPWMRRGGFFDIVGGPDGAVVSQNTAGNSLLRLDALLADGGIGPLRFDPAFALTGGEDTMFFTALRDRGGEVRYAADAVIIEDVSARRASLGWLLRRWYRTGVTAAAVTRARRADGLGLRARLALGGLARLGLGGLGAILTSPLALSDRPAPFAFARVAARGAGFIAGAAGLAFEEYRVDRK